MYKSNLESLFQKGFRKVEQDLSESEKFHNRIEDEMDEMKNRMEQRSKERRII